MFARVPRAYRYTRRVFPKFACQAIAKLKKSLNILAIFPGKALCAVEARPKKAGGILSRVTSAVQGLPERLAQQALNGHIARMFPQFHIPQLPVQRLDGPVQVSLQDFYYKIKMRNFRKIPLLTILSKVI